MSVSLCCKNTHKKAFLDLESGIWTSEALTKLDLLSAFYSSFLGVSVFVL